MQRKEPLSKDQQVALAGRWRKTFRDNILRTAEDPPIISGALSASLFDENLERYLDFTCGGGVLPLNQVDGLVKSSIEELLRFFYQTGPSGETIHGVQSEFVDMLNPLIKGGSRFHFVASENEAMLLAIKMARTLKQKDQVVRLNRRRPIPYTEGIPAYSEGIDPEEVGVVVVSPLDPDTFDVLSKEEVSFLTAARNSGAAVVWDETVTGMGWTGEIFTAPDFATFTVLGGAIGGGIPLGAVVSDHLFPVDEVYGRANVLGSSGIGVTAGFHTLKGVRKQIEQGIVSNLVLKMDMLVSGLTKNVPGLSSTGQGLLRGIRFDSSERAKEAHRWCRERGVLFRLDPIDGTVIQIACPVNASAGLVNEGLGTLGDFLVKERNDR